MNRSLASEDRVYSNAPGKKASIHQVTTMLATSKNVLFPGHNHLLTTGTDDPTLWLSPECQWVRGHQYRWLAGGYGLEIGLFRGGYWLVCSVVTTDAHRDIPIHSTFYVSTLVCWLNTLTSPFSPLNLINTENVWLVFFFRFNQQVYNLPQTDHSICNLDISAQQTSTHPRTQPLSLYIDRFYVCQTHSPTGSQHRENSLY